MKQIKQIANASNFKAVDFGELSELKDYVLELGTEMKIPGKVFEPFWKQTEEISLSKCFNPERKQAFCTSTNNMKNFISFSEAKENFKWTDKSFPSRKAALSESLRRENARYATMVRNL